MKHLIRDTLVATNSGPNSQRGIRGRREPRLSAGQQLRPRLCQLLYCAVLYVSLYAVVGNSANIGLFLSAQEPKPRPCSTVPFRRDNDFVYRDTLAEIHARCAQPAARVALVGLGGVG